MEWRVPPARKSWSPILRAIGASAANLREAFEKKLRHIPAAFLL
jgi:hypothetical protein